MAVREFENAKTEVQGVHFSRYIASWKNVGGDYFGEQFAKWLEANGCTEQEIDDITHMARNGKMELELTARAYVKKMQKMFKEIEDGMEPEEEP